MTLICGDNYAVENQESLIAAALEKFARARPICSSPDPVFWPGDMARGRGALGSAVQSQIGIPVVTGMARENPGADLYRRNRWYIIDSGDSAARMRDVLERWRISRSN